MIVILLNFLTTIHENKFAYVESNKFFMHVDHEKNALCDSYIVESIHDVSENYYEEGTYALTYLNNIKFLLYGVDCFEVAPVLPSYAS